MIETVFIQRERDQKNKTDRRVRDLLQITNLL